MDCHCEMNSVNMVILEYSMWNSIAHRMDLLCDGCIEVRLGRHLTLDDFPTYPVASYSLSEVYNLREIWCNQKYFIDKGWDYRN